MTPYEALVRGGHKHPQQILDDLAREGFMVAPVREVQQVLAIASRVDLPKPLGADTMARVLQRFMEVK